MLLSERTDSRNNNFDFLRFSAALIVLIGHCVNLLGKKNFSWFVSISGVYIFFIISGFLVTLFIAVLSFKFIERPALKLKNKYIYKNLF